MRVVFEYADFLARRGHDVALTFPRRLSLSAPSALDLVRNRAWIIKQRMRNRPLIPWHALHPRVRLLFVEALRAEFMPDADIVVATMWSTAQPVQQLPASKGRKYYLIQGYETWAGPEQAVHATWLLPLRKIVVSKWLQGIGQRLGATQLRYIPNGIDLRHFRVTNPPGLRAPRILSLYHEAEIKGVPDALAVLQMFHARYPEIPLSMFGVPLRGPEIPDWISYHRNPSQQALVDLYNQGTIYFAASLSEGWALPPAEAMACGCVFVGTDSGGVRDYAIDNDTALLSAPRDRDDMLRNLVRVTEDRTLWQRLQKQGTEFIQQFTWERAGSALERYFLE